jgi:hypothetical protein
MNKLAVEASATVTQTVSNVAEAIVPALETYPWWAAAAGILAWVVILAPTIDKLVDYTDTKLDNKIWGFAKAVLGGLTRRKGGK